MCRRIVNLVGSRWLCTAALFVTVSMLNATPVGAHQDPAGCAVNGLDVGLHKDKTQIVNGETVHYTIRVRNDAALACNITGARVSLTCPSPSGTPDGPTTLCAVGTTFPAGLFPIDICEVACVVTVNPGVAIARAKAEVHGTVHDNPLGDLDTVDVELFVSVLIVSCGDGGIDQPGETCDPPGSPAGASGNTCRDNCTVCGDGITDAGESCDDANSTPGDGCENDCTETPSTAICRTPGFWGTHAGTEKTRSVNITEAVIDCADGNCASHTAQDYVVICGEKIDSPDSNPADGTTDVDDAASSTEAICVPVKGDQILQLARQLTAAALNCLISGGGPACAQMPLYATTFADCNSKCAGSTSTKDQLTVCIAELDCLNNGGNFVSGLCTHGAPENCHERLLVNEELGLNFEPPERAGSSDACSAAHASKCNVVGPNEGPPYGNGHCGTDSLP